MLLQISIKIKLPLDAFCIIEEMKNDWDKYHNRCLKSPRLGTFKTGLRFTYRMYEPLTLK